MPREKIGRVRKYRISRRGNAQQQFVKATSHVQIAPGVHAADRSGAPEVVASPDAGVGACPRR